MKYKVLTKIKDGVIVANKTNVICFHDNYVRDDKFEDRMDVDVGQIISDKNVDGADFYWWYSMKEWDKINEGIKKIKRNGL